MKLSLIANSQKIYSKRLFHQSNKTVTIDMINNEVKQCIYLLLIYYYCYCCFTTTNNTTNNTNNTTNNTNNTTKNTF